MYPSPQFVQMKANLAPALYVGDLEPHVTEELLYNYFSKYGPIYVVKIVKDTYTNQSRGYGFITFLNPKDAEQARTLSNNEKILGSSWPIRVMWKRTPGDFINAKANVYVRNIDTSVTPRQLENVFQKCGPINSVKISHTKTSPATSLGYGYVQYANEEAANKSITELNGTKIGEQEIIVEPFKPRTERAENRKNLFLKNLPRLPKGADNEVRDLLQKVFGAFGEISSLAIKYDDSHQGYSAFVCFKTEENATQAYEKTKDTDPFAGHIKPEQANPLPFFVNWFQNKAMRAAEISKKHASAKNETNVYMRNLKLDITIDKLKAVFGVFGKIIDACIKESDPVNKQKHQKLKFACIAFERPEQAQDAIENGPKSQDVRDLFVDPAQVYIRLHETREKRRDFVKTQQRRPLVFFYNQPYPFMYPPGMRPMYNPHMRPPFRYPPMGPEGPVMGPFPPMGPIAPHVRFPGGPRPFMSQGSYHRRPYNNYNRGGNQRYNNQYQNRGRPQGGRPYNNNYNNRNGGYQQRRNHSGPHQRGGQPQAQTQPIQPVQPAQPQARGPMTVASLRENLPEFLKLPRDDQRNILGELLFPQVSRFVGDQSIAPKITGMLVDFDVMEVPEIIELIENQESLIERIKEAEDLITGKAE